jgi:hypothetical protein
MAYDTSGFSYSPWSRAWAMPLAGMTGRLWIDTKEELA